MSEDEMSEKEFQKSFAKYFEKVKGEKPFTDSAQLRKVAASIPLANDNGTVQDGSKRMVAIIGDRFMNGGFVSKAELEKCYKKWNGTLHDINHMGTSTGFFLMQSDITYFIGYQSNAKFDKDTGEVSMDLTIHNKTEFAEAWTTYVELCEMAGQTPNVSVTYYGDQEWVIAKNLPKEANWKKEGYGKDDLVPVLSNIRPVCVSTVLRGRCDDKDGCGLGKGECKPQNKELETKRKELIAQLEKEDNQ